MPIEVKWDNEEKTVLCFEYKGVWEWDDVFPVIEKGDKMIDEVDHPVGIVFDMTESAGVPKGVFSQTKRANRNIHKHVKYRVTVGANRFIEILVSSYQKIYGAMGGESTTAFASTREEAHTLIAEKLASLEGVK